MFRRRQRGEPEDDTAPDDAADNPAATDDPAAAEQPPMASSSGAAPGRPQGPWDVEDAPHDELPRLDLGAVQIPMSEGLEVRVDAQDDLMVSATLVDGHSMLTMHVFAAPRSSGIWTEVREEIAGSLRESGGEAQEDTGPFGPELRARIPAEAPVQGAMLQSARFLGVDGPRWFLRGMLTGPAATDPVQARRLEECFRGTVVVRGGEAMAPRELLPLRLPREAVEATPAPPPRPGLEMLQRGPEITEIQ